MRPSNVLPRQASIAGKRSTGLSGLFSNQPVDYRRYTISTAPGTGTRQSMAPARLPIRPTTNQDHTERAKELIQFFQENNAVFTVNVKDIRDNASRNDFRTWFEFLVGKLNSKYQMPEAANSFGDEIQAITHCLNHYPQIKATNILGMTAPHTWPIFLGLLDWLRRLIIIEKQQQVDQITELQDYTIKYAFDCYKHQKSNNGSNDFSAFLDSVRENILSDKNYKELDDDIKEARENIDQLDSKLEMENVVICEIEEEIAKYKKEIESFEHSEDEMRCSVTSIESKIADVDEEIKTMEAKARNLREDNENLKVQVAAQPMSAYEAQDLLQKRTALRDEFKEKKARHEKLCAIQSEKCKVFTHLATEKTASYQLFCRDLCSTARSFDAEVSYRNFETSLFGKSGGTDSLRAGQIRTDVTEKFRCLMNVIRECIQLRINKINQEALDSKLKDIENKNRMRDQQLQQMKQRNKADLEGRSMAIEEAQRYLKQAETEFEKCKKRADELVAQNNGVRSRVEAQSLAMKELEARISNIDFEEGELLSEFADYMVESSTRFEAYSKMNTDLMKQKEMLLDISIKISEHVQKLLDDCTARKMASKQSKILLSKENISPINII